MKCDNDCKNCQFWDSVFGCFGPSNIELMSGVVSTQDTIEEID